jgi:hypothetical protein
MNLKILEDTNNFLGVDIINLDNNKESSLPHGSGIDATYTIEENKTKDKYIIYNSYHVMNDMGYYICWIDFKLSIPKNKPIDFKLTFPYCNSTGYYWINNIMLRQYLEDIFAGTFNELEA